MSAKLLKSLAHNECTVRNTSNCEVRVYFKTDSNVMDHVTLRSGERRDLTKDATIKQLRKSVNLKYLFSKKLLAID